MKNIFAIIGPTASGKSDLAVKLAKELNSIILSADSLSVYRGIDIASAKPTKEEMAGIEHFGIDILNPDEKFDVTIFINEYKRALNRAKELNKGLIVVGGTSFYIKVLTSGISKMPKVTQDIRQKVANMLIKKDEAFNFLKDIDLEYATKIGVGDSYRLEKALEIYFATNTSPTDYFTKNRPKPIANNLKIYEIAVDRDILRERVRKRTKKMLDMGLIDEVATLEHKYNKDIQPMNSIGVKEVLDYFNGEYNFKELEQKIITNTMRLAKRQVTFNKSQLNVEFRGSAEEIYRTIVAPSN